MLDLKIINHNFVYCTYYSQRDIKITIVPLLLNNACCYMIIFRARVVFFLIIFSCNFHISTQ
uniref:Uncharacterized protein n=1 Tax=Manihot esculenta TaxID=3983 RepID=A0A2C9W346_MANES